jgi:hypothetical protein
VFGSRRRSPSGALSRKLLVVLASLLLVGGLAAVPTGSANSGGATNENGQNSSSDEEGSGDSDCQGDEGNQGKGDAVAHQSKSDSENGEDTSCAEDNDADDQSNATEDNDADDQQGATEDNDADDQPGAAEDNDADDHAGAPADNDADDAHGPAGPTGTSGTLGTNTTGGCPTVFSARIQLHHVRQLHIVKAKVTVNGRKVKTLRGRRAVRKAFTISGLPPSRVTVRIKGLERSGRHHRGARIFNDCPRTKRRHAPRRGRL